MLELVSEFSRWIIPALLLVIPAVAWLKKVKVYETFVEGAEEGFTTAIKIIPYLAAMLIAISIFRASGAMDMVVGWFAPLTRLLGIPGEVLPLAIMRPLSGSGALGLSAELIKTHGPDSFIGRLASTMQGSSDTTFYVLTLYFGSVGIKKYRYSLYTGLLADVTSFLASVYIVIKIFG
ncbi:MAG: spore maturation protein [Thermincolia bacterium]